MNQPAGSADRAEGIRRGDLSLQSLLDEFILSCILGGRSPLTIESHKGKLKRFLGYLSREGIEEAGLVTPAVLRGFLECMRETYHLDDATVPRYLMTLKAFWRWMLDEGHCSSDPAIRVKEKIPKKVVCGLSPGKVTMLLSGLQDKSAQGARNKAIIMILVDSGLRVTELVNLELDDVDIEEGSLELMGKGGKERLVPMGKATTKALRIYMELRESPMEWLWVNRRGGKLTRSGVQQMLRELDGGLGFHLHPHLLRHTFAISFHRNGGTPFELQRILGHKSLEMTRRYCQALNDEDVFKKHKLASPVDNAMRQRGTSRQK